MAPDRFWNSAMETMIPADNEGLCMGNELNVWERAKVHSFHFIGLIRIMLIMSIIFIMAFCF